MRKFDFKKSKFIYNLLTLCRKLWNFEILCKFWDTLIFTLNRNKNPSIMSKNPEKSEPTCN